MGGNLRAFFLTLLLWLEASSALELHVAAPEPTRAPEPWLVNMRLQPRAVGSNTCGWVNGISTSSVTCAEAGAQCASNSLVWGCCSGALSNCILPTVCFETTLANLFSFQANSSTLVCTDATAPYCQTYVRDFGVQYGLGCGPTAGIVSVRSSANGGATVAGGITAAPTGASAAAGSVAATAAGIGGAGQGASDAASTGAANGAQGTSGGGGGNGSGGSSLSTGAIVAIAVCGGVVAIALIALVAFLVHRRRRNQRPSVVQPQAQSLLPQLPPGPPAGAEVASQVGSNAPGQPMTQQNMNAMLGNQPDEWAYIKNKQNVPQHQTAAAQEYDGINVTEIMPEEAVDERRQQEMMSNVGSNVPTAIAPTLVSHHVQGV